MTFLIEHQYVILYFSGAFFSFFAMLSYVKIGNSLVGGRKKIESPEDFFEDFDNDDLETLLEQSFSTEDTESEMPTTHLSFEESELNIESENVSKSEELNTVQTQQINEERS